MGWSSDDENPLWGDIANILTNFPHWMKTILGTRTIGWLTNERNVAVTGIWLFWLASVLSMMVFHCSRSIDSSDTFRRGDFLDPLLESAVAALFFPGFFFGLFCAVATFLAYFLMAPEDQ
jgi:hypothetical protein